MDALACHDISRDQVQILSLGCSRFPFRATRAHRSGGLWRWKDAIDAAMEASARNALGQAYLLVGRNRVVRIDPTVPAGPIALADVRRARGELPPLAADLAKLHGPDIATAFLEAPVIGSFDPP